MPRLCRALALRAARRIQAPRRRRRLGPSLFDDELSGGSADRPRDHEIREERFAVPRLEAGDVERRREDGAGGGGGRVRGLYERYGVGGVSDQDYRNVRAWWTRTRRASLRRIHRQSEESKRCYLDDYSVDDPWQSGDLVLRKDRLRPLSGDGGARGQLGEGWRELHSR